MTGELDRVTLMVAVTEALTERMRAEPHPDLEAVPEERVGTAAIVCAAGSGVLCGLPVAREAFARLGVRLRAVADDGAVVEAGDRVAELGGPVRAMRAAEPTALEYLERLSAIASGAREPDPAAPFDGYAAGFVSPGLGVRDNGPRFVLDEA